jgi:hypothetical protein
MSHWRPTTGVARLSSLPARLPGLLPAAMRRCAAARITLSTRRRIGALPFGEWRQGGDPADGLAGDSARRYVGVAVGPLRPKLVVLAKNQDLGSLSVFPAAWARSTAARAYRCLLGLVGLRVLIVDFDLPLTIVCRTT